MEIVYQAKKCNPNMTIYICELPVTSSHNCSTEVLHINQRLRDILCSPISYKNMFIEMGAVVMLPWKRFLDENLLRQTQAEKRNYCTRHYEYWHKHPTDFGGLAAVVGLLDMVVSVRQLASEMLVKLCMADIAARKRCFSFALRMFTKTIKKHQTN